MRDATRPHPTRRREEAETPRTKVKPFSIGASYAGLRFDLPEGRDWLVTTHDDPSGKPHSYLVTVWVEEGLGRLASCRCGGFKFGRVCRHIRFIQRADSILTRAPVREIRPVYFN